MINPTTAYVYDGRLGRGGMGRGRRCNGGKIALRYARDGGLLKRLFFIYLLRSLEGSMATFRKVRELLLVSYDDGDISEDEFSLLYDANSSKNLDFPYQNYEHFDLEELDESECLAEFRFRLTVIHVNKGLYATELKAFVFS
jgi:hypothetical protein